MHVPFDIKGKLMQIWKSTDIFRRVTRGGRGGRSPLPFFKNWEKVPQFWKKMPWLCPSWVKFLISNVVLRVSRRKINIFFPCGAFLSCVVDEMFIDVPWFRENSPALKNSWLRAWSLSSHKNTMPKVLHYNSIYFLSYAHARYITCLFINIQIQ